MEENMQTEKLLYMQEKTKLEKAEYRNMCRDTHLMQCNGKTCSNPLAHSPYETKNLVTEKLMEDLQKSFSYYIDKPQGLIDSVIEGFKENVKIIDSENVKDFDKKENPYIWKVDLSKSKDPVLRMGSPGHIINEQSEKEKYAPHPSHCVCLQCTGRIIEESFPFQKFDKEKCNHLIGYVCAKCATDDDRAQSGIFNPLNPLLTTDIIRKERC